MSTLQISAPISTRSPAESRRPGPVLRILHAVVEAVGETNRRRAEREIAKATRSHGLATVQLRD